MQKGQYLRLEIENEQIVHIKIDFEATEKTQKRIQEKLDRLWCGEHLRNDDCL